MNPRFPAAVSCNCPCGLVDAVTASILNIMSQMLLCNKELEKDAYAGTGAAVQSCVYSGMDKAGEFFVTCNMEALAAGQGALAYRDGEEACTHHWTIKSQIANIEASEELFPWLYLFRKEAIDTGGPGKFRGGVANVIAIIPWDTDSIKASHMGIGQEARLSHGLVGGYPCPDTVQVLIRNSDIIEKFKRGEFPSDITEIKGQRETLPAFHMYTIYPGDVHIQYQSGGGGFGDPVERAPKLVARDVKQGYVSLEAAKEIYGVVIEPQSLEVDLEKTEKQRQAIIQERLKVGRR